MSARVISMALGDTTRQVRVDEDGTVTVDDTTVRVTPGAGPGEMIVSHDAAVERVFVASDGDDTRWVFRDGETYEIQIQREGGLRRRPQHAGSLTAPMPATVVSLHVAVGDRVVHGATLVVLEAMKMQLPVKAPADGTVTAIKCAPGDLVQPGVPLIEVE